VYRERKPGALSADVASLPLPRKDWPSLNGSNDENVLSGKDHVAVTARKDHADCVVTSRHRFPEDAVDRRLVIPIELDRAAPKEEPVVSFKQQFPVLLVRLGADRHPDRTRVNAVLRRHTNPQRLFSTAAARRHCHYCANYQHRHDLHKHRVDLSTSRQMAVHRAVCAVISK
jgi:hypothetical protein